MDLYVVMNDEGNFLRLDGDPIHWGNIDHATRYDPEMAKRMAAILPRGVRALPLTEAWTIAS